MADNSLTPVVLPALIALGGTLVGSTIVFFSQFLLERSKQVAERRKRKAEKLEELISLLSDHYLSFSKTIHTDDLDVLQKQLDIMGALSGKIQAIITCYFHEMIDSGNHVNHMAHAMNYVTQRVNKNTDEAEKEKECYYKEFETLLIRFTTYSKREFQ